MALAGWLLGYFSAEALDRPNKRVDLRILEGIPLDPGSEGPATGTGGTGGLLNLWSSEV